MKEIPSKNEASLLRGFWFKFDNGEDTIIAGGTSFTGKEYVYVNRELISEKRSVKRISEHIAGKYKVVFNVQSFLAGRMVCSLFVNDQLRKSYKVGFHLNILKLILSFLVASVCGFFGVYFELPLWLITLYIVVALSVFVLFIMPTADYYIKEISA